GSGPGVSGLPADVALRPSSRRFFVRSLIRGGKGRLAPRTSGRSGGESAGVVVIEAPPGAGRCGNHCVRVAAEGKPSRRKAEAEGATRCPRPRGGEGRGQRQRQRA